VSEPGTIDLTGDCWEIREALGLTWQWYVDAPRVATFNNVATAAGEAVRAPGWIAATVPGSVIHDLAAAGEIPDPYVGRNSRAAEWVADRSWVYRRIVHIDTVPPRAVLEIDGIDPSCEVYWDGERVGEVIGLYHRVRIDLGSRVAAGDHQLAIVVGPSPQSEPQVGRTELVRTHSPRMNYGWDFSPRMRHQGIWRGIRLCTAAVQFASLTARTEVDDEGSHGSVVVSFRLEGAARVRADLFDGDVVVATAEVNPEGNADGEIALLHLEIPSPQLWQPLGYGEQHLYRLRVRADGTERILPVGFRSIRMEQNPAGSADALPYTAIVNGARVSLVGWNWVPVDTLYGRAEPERLRHLVALAAGSGARVLRVWGGGLIESDAFYDECDRLGILVWQEFSQSSSGMQSAPATDPDFVAMLRAEAEAIVPTRTHHPSLWMWGGGNELDEGGVPLDESRSPALAALAEVVLRLDPGRHWVPTSPSGPAFHNRLDVIAAAPDDQHDVHGPWEFQGLEAHLALYNRGTSLAHTEFGVEGMTNRRAMESLIPLADRWPADRTNPIYRHLGEWWNNAQLVNDSFGGELRDIESMRNASQLIQSIGLAYAIEADRRRSPRLSMVLPWQLGESYPNAWCTSAVDYRGEPKPAYFAVARAFAATRVTARGERMAWAGHSHAFIAIWVWADHGVGESTVVSARARDPFGVELSSVQFAVGPIGAPQEVGSANLPLLGVSGIFVWDLEWRTADGVLLDREIVIASTSATFAELTTLPCAMVLSTVEWTGSRADVTVRHLEGPLIPGLRLRDGRAPSESGRLLVTGDPRPLLPGDERVLSVDFSGVAHPRGAVLEGWNLAAIEIGKEQ
jgi:beta-mannosidase